MTWRRAIGLLAIVGVLLHVGLVVQHGLRMLAPVSEEATLARDLLTLCTGGAEHGERVSQPGSPLQPVGAADCALCLLHGATHMLVAAWAADLPLFDASQPALARVAALFQPQRLALPPARGPAPSTRRW